jgi:flagellar protein FlaI
MAQQDTQVYHLTKYLDEYHAKYNENPIQVEKLDDEYRNLERVNLIYPIGNDTFIHVDTTHLPNDKYPDYHIILPKEPNQTLRDVIEKKFAIDNADIKPPKEPENKIKFIEDYFEKIFLKTADPQTYENIAKLKQIPIYIKDIESIKYYFIRKHVGLDLLEPYLSDPYIEDISMVGEGGSFIVHKLFGPMRVIQEINNDDLEQMLITMAEQFGKSISNASPVIDARLPDGSRINIVFGVDISPRGTNITIRRFAGVPISITQLINYKTITAKSAAYLWMLLNEGMSIFVCGETASGKTTTVTALTSFINSTKKIVSIEDTPEITLPQKQWVSEVTRDTGSERSSIQMQDLLKAALRQRPNYIIVGEIRGVEASVAFQAMQTGHPVISTFHAANINSLTQRLVNPPINIPRSNIDNLNVALFQSAVTNNVGKTVRRVLSINEIIGFDSSTGSILVVPLFNWDPETDLVNFSGEGTSQLFKEKLLLMRGMAENQEHELYEEMELREQLLSGLVERKIFNYFQVFNEIAKANHIGIENYLKENTL